MRCALTLAAILSCWTAASPAFAQCGPGAGDCCSANGSPGCDQTACCESVCAADPFCCDVSWDGICADGAAADPNCICQCGPACGKSNVACLGPGPEFDNARVVGQLRALPGGPGFCTAWIIAGPDILLTDNHCQPLVGDVVAFDYECDSCTGGACKPVQEFGVTQIVACNAGQDWCLFRVDGNVAALFGQAQIDPAPATLNMPIYEVHHAEGDKKGYDQGQVTGLFLNVNCPGNIQEHSVSVIASQGASGSPVFRQDNHCVTAVCNCGPPCAAGLVLPMSTMWPNIQAALEGAGGVFELCGQQPPCPGDGDCCVPNGGPGCEREACCQCVCDLDSFCCDTEWDSVCADLANADCAVECPQCSACGDAGSGDCCDNANLTPNCEDAACCDCVCSFDPFCCDTSWDASCAGQACEACAAVCDCCCPQDLNGDGQIGPEDLAQLLGAWGPNPGHPADLDGDGSVDAPDLAQLLGAWGPC